MLEQKAFLAAACENVSQLLESILRYEYAEHIDEKVFSTLKLRIEKVRNSLELAEIQGLSALTSDLIGIARNISQIERSHLGEFSWVFVEHFKILADKVCIEQSHTATLINDSKPNLDNPIAQSSQKYNQVHFFYSSDPGLIDYKLVNNQNDAGGARVFSLQFPRAQKHSVLMHGLLAHELGHALPRINNHWNGLIRDGFENTPLAWPVALQPTDFLEPAPEAFYNWAHSYQPNLDRPKISDLAKIMEEVFCDLIGLLLFGPGFVFALVQNLWSLDPQGLGKNSLPTYPPFRARIAVLVDAMRILKWNENISAQTFQTLTTKITGSYSKVIDGKVLSSFLNTIKSYLPPDACYQGPEISVLASVKQDLKLQIPPKLQSLQKDPDTQKISILPLEKLDFRDVILAGWEAYFESDEYGANDIQKAAERFVLINKLCEKALANMLAFKGMQKVKS